MHEANKKQDSHLPLSELKAYFETIQMTSSDSENLLSYYALPFVQNPKMHPSFAHLFTKAWSNQLRAQILSYVQANTSELQVIYSHYLNCPYNQHTQTIEKSERLENNAKKDDATYSNDIVELGSVVNRRANSERSNEIEEQSPILVVEENIIPNIQETSVDLSKSALDFEKLKEYIYVCSDGSLLYRVLHELKCRLRHSHKGKQRKFTLLSYISCDLLGLCESNGQLLNKLLNSGQVVKTEAVLLIISMCKYKEGIHYFINSVIVIKCLIEQTISEEEETPNVICYLNALLRFSTHKCCANIMIESGLIQWAINIFDNVIT